MGSKKRRRPAPPAPVAAIPAKSAPWPLISVAVAAVAAIGLFLWSPSSDGVASQEAAALTTQTPATATSPATSATAPAPDAAPAAAAPVVAEGPNDLPMPPLPYVPPGSSAPAELLRQAYVFAAQNPGVLGYVPCYCGCGQTDGHISNNDCFVGSRAPNGAVESWDSHGMT